jgi:hypothetical protein
LDGVVYAGAETGLFAQRGDALAPVSALSDVFVFDLAPDADGSLWAATADGLVLLQNDAVVGRWTEEDYLLSNMTRALALDGEGRLWIGTPNGLNVLDQRRRVIGYTGGQGLPYLDITRLRWVGDGPAAGLWIGTSRGAIRFADNEWSYYAGRRWIPDDNVSDAAPGSAGQLWLATGNGAAQMGLQETTLADKAAYYLSLTEKRHERYGLVAPCDLELPGDLSTFRLRDANNDGLFTGQFLAASSFAYAATGDEQYRDLADRHFAALALLEQVTGIPGLPARSIAPLYTYSADPSCAPFCQWQANEDLGWDWKSDEGSDELTGQFFGLAIYFDLAADDDHRAAAAQLAARILQYIISHDYYLIDWDGQPTSTGVFNPAALWQWLKQPAIDEKLQHLAQLGPNGAAILAMLRAAMHMTGQSAFADAYDSLLREHAMAEFLVDAAKNLPMISDHAVYQLFFLDYYLLLSYEDDAARRAEYLAGLRRIFGFVRIERNSLFNFIYGAMTAGAEDFAVGDAAFTLRRVPLDLIDWRMENSQRADVMIDPFPNRLGQAISSTGLPPLPPDQRAIMDWGGDPFVLDAGGYGASEEAGTFWLLPYWMGRYYGFLGD